MTHWPFYEIQPKVLQFLSLFSFSLLPVIHLPAVKILLNVTNQWMTGEPEYRQQIFDDCNSFEKRLQTIHNTKWTLRHPAIKLLLWGDPTMDMHLQYGIYETSTTNGYAAYFMLTCDENCCGPAYWTQFANHVWSKGTISTTKKAGRDIYESWLRIVMRTVSRLEVMAGVVG